GVGVGVGFAIAMLGEKADRDSACSAGSPCPSSAAFDQASAADSTARSDRTIALVAGGVGIAAVVAGVVPGTTAKKPTAPAAGVWVGPISIRRANVVGLGGSF